MNGTLSQNGFSADPAYLAALEAAAASSVLGATRGLAGLALQQPFRGLATSAAAPSDAAAQDARTPPPPPPPRPKQPVAAEAGATPQQDAPGTDGSKQRRGAAGKGAGGGGPQPRPRSRSASPRSRRASSPSGASPASASPPRARPPQQPKQQQQRAAEVVAAAVAAAALGRAPHAPAPAATSGAGREGGKERRGQGGAAAAAVGAALLTPNRFTEYLSPPELQRGFKTGQLWRGKLRVNPGDRREGYVSIPGFPHDVMLRGERAQNRAIEGDTVALALCPVTDWFTHARTAAAQREARRAGGGGGGDKGGVSGGGGEMPLDLAAALAADSCPWRSVATPDGVKTLLGRLAAARPELRITGTVVSLLPDALDRTNPRRERIVGLLALGVGAAEGAGARAPPAPDAASPAPSPHLVSPATCYLLPLDPRLPRCVVRPAELKNLPPALLEELRLGERAESRTLMSARIAEWTAAHAMPSVTLRASLGQAGEIESETAALLEQENVRAGEFSPEVLACLPPIPWAISAEERAKRRDFTTVRVFSIDPPTAKDLDDALSIEPLPGGGWRVGVHIADVAHFIPPFSALDIEAGTRGTSIYLVQRVVPMLPPLLCEELCSLNPGVERLAFSVVWDMRADGTVQSTWFGRSVIRSCVKLAYPHVQAMIEGRFDPAACPAALHGEGVTWEQVVSDSLSLWSLAARMRSARFDGGALRLDGVKLSYRLDAAGNPVDAAPYVQQEANQLVEEFMLLANRAVADRIATAFPERALLRRHPPPNATKLRVFAEAAAAAGMPVDTSSAAAIQQGLNALRAMAGMGRGEGGAAGGTQPAAVPEDADPALLAAALGAAAAAADVDATLGSESAEPSARSRRLVELLVMLATRPMQLAEYFCTGLVDDPALWRHYALAVPAYTHFTSPIRRYPDVVVHRLLAAALEAQEAAGRPGGLDGSAAAEAVAERRRLLGKELTGKVAEHCNERRLAARAVQDGSLRLYLCVLLRRHPVLTTAIVSNVGGERFFGAYLPEFGHEVTLTVGEQGVAGLAGEWNAGARVLTLTRRAGGEGGDGGEGREGGGRGGGRGRGGRGGRGNSNSNGGNKGGGEGGGEEVVEYGAWVASLPAARNPRAVQPAALPLHLALFAEVPLILTAVTVPGRPSELLARLYLPEAEPLLAVRAAAAGQEGDKEGERARREAEAEAAAGAVLAADALVAAGAEGVEEAGLGLRESSIPWDSTLND